MKFTHLIAAGLAFATLGLGAAAPAEAQRNRGYSERHDDRGPRGDHRGDRHDFRGNDHRGDRHDDRRYRGRDDRRNWNNNRRCRTEWRHHRRVQICR